MAIFAHNRQVFLKFAHLVTAKDIEEARRTCNDESFVSAYMRIYENDKIVALEGERKNWQKELLVDEAQDLGLDIPDDMLKADIKVRLSRHIYNQDKPEPQQPVQNRKEATIDLG